MLNLTDEELSQAHKEGWTLAYGGTHLRRLYNEVGNPIIPTLIEGYMMILRKAKTALSYIEKLSSVYLGPRLKTKIRSIRSTSR